MKVSEEFLPRVFAIYFEILKLDNRLNKSNFYTLADLIEPNELDPEFFEVLDLIVAEAKKAVPKRGLNRASVAGRGRQGRRNLPSRLRLPVP
jgi:hypothetical protein